MLDTPTIQRFDILDAKLDTLIALVESRIAHEFLTIEESSGLLRCSKSKIRDLIRLGKLKFSRLDPGLKSKIIIRRKDLDGMIG